MFLCVDFGSTFTKAVLVDERDGTLVARHAVPTTTGTDVLEGYHQLRAALRAPDQARVLACSSAGGGLRLAVVGHERQVTAEAGHRVGLSAGAKVVHVASGPMRAADVAALRRRRPDVILLVGGTDGGNAEVLLHNADRLARSRVGAPVVLAGNAEAADRAAAALAATGRRFVVSHNVLPRIGRIRPGGARAAIREVFLSHVIGGKGLSRGTTFARMVGAATPDAMLTGVEVLAGTLGGDVLVVDVGGATTDVYSVISPAGEDAELRRQVVAPLHQARTVEADLGLRWNAPEVLAAAGSERLPVEADMSALTRWVEHVHAAPATVPATDTEQRLDLELARLAVLTAVRRHARAPQPGDAPRPLADVTALIGSGGVLRHAGAGAGVAVLQAVTADVAGGWKVPRAARTAVDTQYRLFAAGLLAAEHPDLAAMVAAPVAAR